MWHADGDHRSTGMARARRPLIVAAIVGGAILQHILVAAPPEPALTPPTTPPRPTAPAKPAPLLHAAPPAAHAGAQAQMPGEVVAAAGDRLEAGAPSGTTSGNRQDAGGPSGMTAGGRLEAGAPSPVHPVSVVKGARLLAPRPPAPAAVAQPVVLTTAARPAPSQDAALTAAIWRGFNAFALPYQTDSALIVAVARQFGIDPAIPAALFMHEDGNINNRALFPQHMNWLLYNARNPGNIKCMYDPCYQGFQVYPTYRAGILDWFRLYDHYYYDLGIHDLGRFVATYCPPGVDGNGPPSAYQNDVLALAARIHAGW